MGRKLDKFLLLMWKNWKLQVRHPVQTLVEILAPVLFSILLVVIRSLVEPESFPDPTVYKPFTIDSFVRINNYDLEGSEIAYSPDHNDILNSIMNKTVERLNAEYNYTMTVSAYENATMLELHLLEAQSMAYTLAGVQFNDDMPNDKLPFDLDMVIRFPSETRAWFNNRVSFARPNWQTNLLFPLYQMPGPRNPKDDFGGAPGYMEDGFLPLQHSITYQIISEISGVNVSELPEIWMERYPYPPYIQDPLLTALQSFVSIIILLSFVYTCISTVRVITTEKEKQLKESMKIMGLPNWLHWTAWFIKSFSFVIISVALIVILLKVTWYPNSNHSVFTLSDPFVIFFFMLMYMCATITFCFAISVFFSKANTAAAIAGLIWFLSYFPYSFLQPNYSELGLGQKMFVCLGLNSAMSYGFQLMLMFEGTGEGMQWSTIFTSTTPDDSFTLAHVIGMLILDAIIYLVIALYVEAVFPGEYGVPQKWYFPITANYWCGMPPYAGVEDDPEKSPQHTKEMYENEPVNLPAGIQIKNLKKVFGNKVAVRHLTLNMYEGQITVLLGHNGAGKTTTMSMLTGMYPPSSGTAIVNNHDIREDMDGVRDSLGLCPQHNVLFDDLTVKEHLYFFGKLKGLSGKALVDDINKYINLLELQPKTNAQSKTLSGGMKRKLSVGIALCGNSKVVMLDEPTAGMDPAARRALWDLLQGQKADRTILLSTHFMDEADLLGDRIAIMAGGMLQCYGSSFFLKKRYGAGYHLIMDKAIDCDTSKVTDLLAKYIPNIHIQNNVGSELTYLLPEDKLPIFEEMLQDLEQHSDNMGILSYGISLTTLEEVFMKVGADHGQEEANDSIDSNNIGDFVNKELTNGNSVNGGMDFQRHSSDTKLDVGSMQFLTGTTLWFNQFRAMLAKRILSIIRSWILLVIQIMIPVIFMILAVIVVRSWKTIKDLQKLDLTLDSYNDPVTVISTNMSGTDSATQKFYKDYLTASGHRFIDYGRKDMVKELLTATQANIAAVRLRYISGASFLSDNKIIVWFNNEPFHSSPLTLNLVHNALLQQYDSKYKIHVSNFPLPFTLESKFNQLETGNNMGFQLAFNIGFSMALVSSFYILFYVRERVTKAKHLQFVSGVQVYTFWGAAFLCDLITFFFTSVCLLVTLVCFQEEGFKTFDDMGRLFVCFLYFGWSMLPMMYCGSFFFSIPSTGFVRTVLLNIFTGVAAFLVVEVLASPGLDLENIANALHWGFLLVPHYSLSSGVRDINTVFAGHKLCSDLCNMISPNDPQNCFNSICLVSQRCCDMSESYFGWESPGIGRNVLFSMMVGCCLLVILIAVEYRVPEKIMYKLMKQTNRNPTSEEGEDDDVANEKRLIRNGTKATLANYSLVMKDMTKYYKDFLAVDRLCVGVKRGECFGLLGINGAGKTTTFKMLTGDERITYGEAWINGLSLKTNMKTVHKSIGYCPQFDALLDDLTGRETMQMFCLLRGIKIADSKYIIQHLSEDFDFVRHLDKKVKEYSGGNKRKLSTAISLIGDPPVVYLDEPTTGMDPAAKRHLWNALCKVRDTGRCIILTSHSMEECEALCTRLAIMVNGNFKCIGSTQHLKSKFSEGYTLTIKVKLRPDTQLIDEIEPIHNFVTQQFKGAVLREQFQELLTYYIEDKSLPWSRMFGIMEASKRELNIEDYSLGQASLEQVFLTFTKYQRATDD